MTTVLNDSRYPKGTRKDAKGIIWCGTCNCRVI